MEKINKNHFNNPIVIFLILIILGVGGYFLLNKNSNTPQDNTLNPQQTEIDALKKTVEDLKNQKPQTIINKPATIINTPTQGSIVTDKTLSTADLVDEWTPNIAQVICSFSLENDQQLKQNLEKFSVNTEPVILGGSGFVKEITTEQSGYKPVIAVLTNRHVVGGAYNGFSFPSSCKVILPNNHEYTVTDSDVFDLHDEAGKSDEIKFINGQPYAVPPVDAAWIWIRNPDTYTIAIATKPQLCSVSSRIGDNLIILGYPGIGSDTGITATEGIISGLETNYFVTSAKVEHGNSGGAAISKEHDCYLGIPSYVVTGSVESLARILDYRTFFK